MSQTVVTVEGLTYGFSAEQMLFEKLNLHIRQGEFVVLLAPSGAGKTTLFRLLAGLIQPLAGSITFAGDELREQTHSKGKDAGDKQASDKRGKKPPRVGYMPQRDSLMPWLTVTANAAIGLELSGMSRKEARRRVLELLPAFGLAGTEKLYPYELSGGMRQRVAFMRSVLTGADLLLLDEPFGALDAMLRIQLQQWLLELWEREKSTILFITHDIDEALLLADRILIASEKPIRQLYELPVHLPRPRGYATSLSAEFVQLKAEVLRQLGESDLVGVADKLSIACESEEKAFV